MTEVPEVPEGLPLYQVEQLIVTQILPYLQVGRDPVFVLPLSRGVIR
jgi:hypothetical protein